MKNISKLRRIFGSKPNHFAGTEHEWSQLIMSLLAKPDHTRTWTRKERKSKKGNMIVEWVRE
jgi:hypothetical protein